MSKFTREISFTPAYDKRHAESSKNYGVHGVDVHFKLKCPLENRALTFTVYSGWMLPHVESEYRARQTYIPRGMGADVSLHKLALLDAEHDFANCELVGGPCKVVASSGLTGDDCFQVLVAEGGEALWLRLEALYEAWSNPA